MQNKTAMGRRPIAFLLSPAANSGHSAHMLYHLKPGGVRLKSKKPAVICAYAAENPALIEIIQSSFRYFLKKELQSVEELRDDSEK